MANILPASSSNGNVIEVVKNYIGILNNNQYSLELEGGNIDISYKSNEYIFSLGQLKFAGKVPATENTSEIDAEFTLNGSLKLSGKNNYSNAEIYKKPALVMLKLTFFMTTHDMFVLVCQALSVKYLFTQADKACRVEGWRMTHNQKICRSMMC